MIEWVGSVVLLLGVGLITLGDTRLMALACLLNLIGDLLLVAFFVINFNLAMIILNAVFAVLSVIALLRWKDRSRIREVLIWALKKSMH